MSACVSDDRSVLKRDLTTSSTCIYLWNKWNLETEHCVFELLNLLEPYFSTATDFQYVATSAEHKNTI